jgi:hypothetical protein
MSRLRRALAPIAVLWLACQNVTLVAAPVCRPNPSFANNSRYSSAGKSNQHGLHVSLVQPPARWGAYRVSYTSKAMNDVGEFFFQLANRSVRSDERLGPVG